MNRIFFAMVVVAFGFAAWGELTWEPPSPPAVEAPAASDVTDPEVAALQERVRALEQATAPAVEAPKRPMAALQDAILDKAKASVDLVISLIGSMAFFLGLMKVAQDGGLLTVLSRLISPVLVRLFPEVPPDHPAMGAMILNLSANALGLGNAATPFGVKAMQELDRLNPTKGTATNAMALFLAINTSSVTLLPTGVIVFREALGSVRPADVVPTTLFATLVSTSVAIVVTKTYQRFAPTAEEVTPPDEIVALAPPEAEAPDQAYPLWVSLTALAVLVASIPLTLVYGAVVAPWIIPGLAVGLLGFGAARGVGVYSSFVEGAKEGWDLAVKILPYLVAILCAVGMLQASGALDAVIGVLDPITAPLGLPGSALPMALLRPLSGSGALGIMASIMSDPATGPDTYVGLLVSTLQGSTETTFYVLAVYYGAVQVQRVRHTLAAALTADLAGVIGAVIAASAMVAWSL